MTRSDPADRISRCKATRQGPWILRNQTDEVLKTVMLWHGKAVCQPCPPDHQRRGPVAMMAPCDKKIALEFKRRAAELAGIIQFCAFGSRARGDAAAGSDLDVFLVVDHIDAELREKISEVAWEVGFEHGLVIMALCYPEADFASGPRSASPLVRNILSEGVVV